MKRLEERLIAMVTTLAHYRDELPVQTVVHILSKLYPQFEISLALARKGDTQSEEIEASTARLVARYSLN